MKAIWKFPIPMLDKFPLIMPENSTILSVQTQHDEAQIWALVNPENPAGIRNFQLVGTGHLFSAFTLHFIGTFQLRDGAFVGHLFEEKS